MGAIDGLQIGAWYFHANYPNRVVQVGIDPDGEKFGILYSSDGSGGWNPYRGIGLDSYDAGMMTFAWK